MSGAQKSRWEDVDDSDGHRRPDSRDRRHKTKRKKYNETTAATTKDKLSSIVDNTAPNMSTSSEPNTPVHALDINESKISTEHMASPFQTLPTHLAQDFGHLSACRQIDLCYEKLNKIEEGTYGIVYRAKDISTGEIVALKHLKLDQERNGFPITSLREIHTLLLAKHPNIINVREIVVGKSLNSIYMVMDFMEHDLRTLMESMRESFRPSEVKSLLLQLCSAIAHLHGNWIVHRDLKTSNLLMASGGALRVADFGLARKYSSPLGHMTGLVVTLWYRAPELLMGEKQYSTAVDMWSVGCIFAELFVGQPLFQGRGEIDQITRIFAARGVPNKLTWPDFDLLPNAKVFKFSSSPDPSKLLRARMQGYDGMTENAYDLLTRMLALDPKRRISAHEALDHPYFTEHPPPKDPSMFPTWPTRSNNS